MSNPIERAKERREERREERHRQEILRLSGAFDVASTQSDAEIDEIRRWEGSAAAAEAIAKRSAPRQYTAVSKPVPTSAGRARGVYDPTAVVPTNTMAVLALVFGIGGGVLGIVFGHIALSQIDRTGEGGRGLATAGLILGYLGTAGSVIFGIWYATVIGSLL